MERSKAPAHLALFGWVAAMVFSVDQLTKLIAVGRLAPSYVPRNVIGSVFRFTLVYNPGAAFGLHLGPYSREIFTVLTLGALVLLYQLYRQTVVGDISRVVAISLVTGGALGNLIDRLRSARGVVDFIDVGIGGSRWPTFNVADMAVSCGAILLAIVLWREDNQRRTERHATDPATEATDTAIRADAPIQG